jgi:hypothetical protein
MRANAVGRCGKLSLRAPRTHPRATLRIALNQVLEKCTQLFPPGTTVYLGSPANPTDPAVTKELGDLAGSFSAVQEAHLPQCWVKSLMQNAARILVVVFADGSEKIEEAARAPGVSRILPRSSHLDVWFMTLSDPLLESVRRAQCKIFDRSLTN